MKPHPNDLKYTCHEVRRYLRYLKNNVPKRNHPMLLKRFKRSHLFIREAREYLNQEIRIRLPK